MLGQLLRPEIQELVQERDIAALRGILTEWDAAEVADLVDLLPAPDDAVALRLLPRDLAADVFENLGSDKQRELVEALAHEGERLAQLLEDLSPDDRTAFLEELPGPVVQRLLQLLSPEERRVAITLLGYPEESIGRLMTPEYVAVRPDWSVEQALDHIRRHGQDSETLNVILGFLRVATGEWAFHSYGAFWPLIGLTVCVSLLGVVLWGTLSGALLPLLLKRLGADPAVPSTPFVATLVDVTGLVIYFTVAALLLRGSLL